MHSQCPHPKTVSSVAVRSRPLCTMGVAVSRSLTPFESEKWKDTHRVDEPYRQHADKACVYHDMSLPLSHYWISAGHNSYLTGNQLVSESGVSTIELSLKNGCKVIELDIYNQPNGVKTGPICKHGGTLTRPITARGCVVGSFLSDPGRPSTSHGLNLMQVALAQMLFEEVGDALYIPSADPYDPRTHWKSPQELVNKILIRTAVKASTSPELADLVYVRNFKVAQVLEDVGESLGLTSSSVGEDKVFKGPQPTPSAPN
ncbi:MAG: hypothetical protein WDW38_005002 [Sanguina aurantia]